ncbi:hypothetical protein GW17_00017427, partial [Ensete ventricosum]
MSSCPRTISPPTWSTRHGKAGLTQVRRGQRSYGRPNTGKVGKVDIPQLAHGFEPTVLAQQTRRQTASTGQAQEFFFPIILALEGGPISQERPFGNSVAEHRPELNHSQPTKEVTTAALTPNRFWRMMTDPGFPSPASNPVPFVVTVEAFLGLTSQVQALAGMVQTIVPYLPQLIQSATHQLAPPTAFSQTESPVALNREIQLEAEPSQCQVAEAHTTSPIVTPAWSQSCSCDPIQTSPDLDTLSSDTADSLREQVRQVH